MRNPLTAVRLALAGLRLVRDPNRLEQAIGLADRLGESPAFLPILEHVRSLPGGPAALADRPRVAIELPYLRTLAPGTFGRATADFLDARRLDPADLPHRPASDELGWLRAHLFETHDLWHVVTGFDTDVAGEAGLQAFYLAQFPARLASLLLALIGLNTFLYAFDDRDRRMDAIAHGWRLGRQARPFLAVRWAELWERPLAQVQAELGLPSAAVAPVARAA
ncbi:MAG: hypothetical protein KBG48_07050 [Kofleriaceae bacterium]|jgi:ubiquinone biosynthesis protein COQ4|nr:hypothetical protein [Kofleriaceae bacterium]MBP9167126.1 hypothetical protein [Kofleriaceae bacterium]MBP9860953.1 hypothetical protein [Kofleriaceae bacterium]